MLPSASGAAIERADRISAAFQGAIAPTTPTGRRSPIENAPDVGRDHLAERGVGERRRLAEQARHEVRLEHRESERAAGLAREQRDDLVLPRLEDVGGLEEDPLAHPGRCLRPLGERGLGGGDRARRILAPACGDVGDRVAGERIAGLERVASGGVDPLAADELPALRGAGLRVLLLQLHRVLLRGGSGPTLSTCSRGQYVIPASGTTASNLLRSARAHRLRFDAAERRGRSRSNAASRSCPPSAPTARRPASASSRASSA